ncbi:MAG TPA: bifunctional DNA-formamidopyrimidine glycosylase/DNA-(apurinic or apyrimidinic site) lyase [Polyangia bacterium]|nr:bifunctional DNA-formamidopyrimidine glycosylase/DNA-(apurinic or apyrimidinic site) lyase [Polyangia bacterium]
MPELPEVEVAARNLRRWLDGRRVRAASAAPTSIVGLEGTDALAPLVGARGAGVERVGKHLLMTFARGRTRVGLWSHLGMTGKWLRRARGDDAPRFSHAALRLDDGATLHYCDMRRLGRLRVVPDAAFDESPRLRALGPDPLRDGVDAGKLHVRLARVRLPIKVALLDQTVLAGVGNIQASEACWRARLDPRRAAAALTRAEVGRLARAIRASIRYTLARFATDGADAGDGAIVYVEENRAANPFKVYGRRGAPCPRCGTPITRIVQAQRSTFFCAPCLVPKLAPEKDR